MNDKEKISTYLNWLSSANNFLVKKEIAKKPLKVTEITSDDALKASEACSPPIFDEPQKDLNSPLYLLYDEPENKPPFMVYWLTDSKWTIMYKNMEVVKGSFAFTKPGIIFGIENGNCKILTEDEAKAWFETGTL